MRKDMKDVIVNSPRVGGYKYTAPRFKADDDSTHQKFERMNYYGYAREMTNRLVVVNRYLRSKVGWHFDDIWADVCRTNHKTSFRSQHLRGHVLDFIYKVTHGVRYCLGGYCNYANSHPVIPDSNCCAFYLDEKNILRELIDRRWRAPKPKKSGIVDFNKKVFYQHEGIWYEIETANVDVVTLRVSCLVNDAFNLCHYTTRPAEEVWRVYHGRRYPVTKRQINSREIKKLEAYLATRS